MIIIFNSITIFLSLFYIILCLLFLCKSGFTNDCDAVLPLGNPERVAWRRCRMLSVAAGGCSWWFFSGGSGRWRQPIGLWVKPIWKDIKVNIKWAFMAWSFSSTVEENSINFFVSNLTHLSCRSISSEVLDLGEAGKIRSNQHHKFLEKAAGNQ